jgi:hypothetical protein
MATIATQTVQADGHGVLVVKVLTRLEAAARSAGRVWCYAAGAIIFTNRAEIITAIGNGSDRPDFTTLEGIGKAAITAGVAAAAALVVNWVRPKTTVAAK